MREAIDPITSLRNSSSSSETAERSHARTASSSLPGSPPKRNRLSATDAVIKLFVTASPEVRARRRLAELTRRGLNVHYDEVLHDIHARDERDSGRSSAPLVQADDALLLDTSDMDVEQAVAAAIALADQRVAVRKTT